MADLNSSYTLFDVYDYKNDKVLSSYNLPKTPLKFVADLSLYPTKDVRWSFGDGTISDSLTAVKYYEFPGVYPITLIVYDCRNNAIVSSYTANVEIKDFIPFSMTFTNLSSNKGYLDLEQSKIHGPWNITATYPSYQNVVNIKYSTLSSSSLNYGAVASKKFAHLEKTRSVLEATYNYYLSAYQYYEIPEISVKNPIPIFAKIDTSNQIVLCDETEADSFFVGTSAFASIYYKDDSVGKTSLIFKFNNTDIGVSEFNNPYLNMTNVALSANIIANNDADHLSITSNGLDGEKTPIESFNIHKTKFYDVEIPFVIKVKDSENYSLKNFNILELSSFNISVLSASNSVISSNYYTVSSLNGTISDIDHGGSFRGFIKFPTLDYSLDNVQLSCSASIQNENLSSFSLSGISSKFNVIPHNYYDIYKINEDFNAAQTLKDLAFQENIKNNPVLFDDFFAAILGSDEYDHDSIGVKIYESIENFIMNNHDVDTENVKALMSDLRLVDSDELIFDKSILNYPETIKRVVSLASVKLNNLIGTTNKFDQNFDIKGYSQKDVYGRNIGNRINTTQYTISAGTPIVALEKFSNTYTLLNTYQPLCAGTGSFYNLSAYTSDWGWPMVLPTVFNPSLDFDKYYTFFEYVSGYDNTIVGNIIDFNNSKTTINSQSANNSYMYGAGGVFDTMFLDALYQSLSL